MYIQTVKTTSNNVEDKTVQNIKNLLEKQLLKEKFYIAQILLTNGMLVGKIDSKAPGKVLWSFCNFDEVEEHNEK